MPQNANPSRHEELCASVFEQMKEQINEEFRSYLQQIRALFANANVPEQCLMSFAFAEYWREMDFWRSLYQPDAGYLLIWGSPDSGELGRRDPGLVHPNTTLFPRRESGLRDIAGVAVGSQHNLAVLKDGTVHSWGSNDSGQVGRETQGENDDYIPDELRSDVQGRIQGFVTASGALEDSFTIKVAAGDSCSASLTRDGRVFFWGSFIDDNSNMFRPPVNGQSTEGTINKPVEIQVPRKAKNIACGKVQLICVLEDESLWSMGIKQEDVNGRKTSALARGDDLGDFSDEEQRIKNFLTLRPMLWGINAKVRVISLACSQFHTMVVGRTDGSPVSAVWACGMNNFGQLGLGHFDSVSVLTKSPSSEGKNIAEVQAGQSHSLALDIHRRHLYVCGRPNEGRLGIFNNLSEANLEGTAEWTPVQFPEHDIEITSFSCGDAHCIVATSKGTVYTWGFGEQGQLGHGANFVQPGQTTDVVNSEWRPRPMVDVTREIDDQDIVILGVYGGAQHSAILYAKK